MKNAKKLLVLTLVVMSVLVVAVSAMAADWSDRYSDITLYKNTQGDVDDYIRHVQTDINTYYANYTAYQIVVDGYYGDNTVAAVKRFQSNMGLSSDGFTGPATKAKLWDVYNGTISPLPK